MTIFFSPATSTFHDGSLGLPPSDAIPISNELHLDLLTARSNGDRIVVGEDGLPIAILAPRAPVKVLRRQAQAAIKRVAAQRILEIAPLWRQLNDARELPAATGDTRAAILARYAAIDAVRVASDAAERQIASLNAQALAGFNPSHPDHWPAEP